MRNFLRTMPVGLYCDDPVRAALLRPLDSALFQTLRHHPSTPEVEEPITLRVRLADIARAAGVSESTVSRVLNERGRVNEETRQTVLSVARRLGRDFLPDGGGAQSLPPMVGLLVPDTEDHVHSQWIDHLESELFACGVAALIGVRARTVDREREYLLRFSRAGARGVVVVSGFHSRPDGPIDHYDVLAQVGVPLVVINGVRKDLEATFISIDTDRAIDLALAHLRALGHRRIGLAVGDEPTWLVNRKVGAFRDRQMALGVKSPDIAYTTTSSSGGYEAAIELVRGGMTAIICGSDAMASGAIDGALSLGASVPGDVSVIGHDDVSWAELTAPPLTTIRQNVPLMAQSAVRALLSVGEGSRRPPRTELLVRPQLVVRGTTAAARRTASSKSRRR